MKVTNTSTGPRGLNTKDGPVMLEVGESRDLDLLPEEWKSSKATGWFEIEGIPETKKVDVKG